MEKQDFKQFKLIHSTDADEFEKLYNEAIEKLAGKRVEVSDPIFNGKEYVGILSYNKTELNESTFTFKDDFHRAGEVYLCAQCPYCEWSDDKRRKRIKCPFSEYGLTRKDSECCEMFYRRLANHDIEVVGGRI